MENARNSGINLKRSLGAAIATTSSIVIWIMRRSGNDGWLQGGMEKCGKIVERTAGMLCDFMMK